MGTESSRSGWVPQQDPVSKKQNPTTKPTLSRLFPWFIFTTHVSQAEGCDKQQKRPQNPLLPLCAPSSVIAGGTPPGWHPDKDPISQL